MFSRRSQHGSNNEGKRKQKKIVLRAFHCVASVPQMFAAVRLTGRGAPDHAGCSAVLRLLFWFLFIYRLDFVLLLLVLLFILLLSLLLLLLRHTTHIQHNIESLHHYIIIACTSPVLPTFQSTYTRTSTQAQTQIH